MRWGLVRWLRFTIGEMLVRWGVAILPQEPEVEAALYRWVSTSHLHRREK